MTRTRYPSARHRPALCCDELIARYPKIIEALQLAMPCGEHEAAATLRAYRDGVNHWPAWCAIFPSTPKKWIKRALSSRMRHATHCRRKYLREGVCVA